MSTFSLASCHASASWANIVSVIALYRCGRFNVTVMTPPSRSTSAWAIAAPDLARTRRELVAPACRSYIATSVRRSGRGGHMCSSRARNCSSSAAPQGSVANSASRRCARRRARVRQRAESKCWSRSRAASDDAYAVAVDICDEASVAHALAEAAEHLGGIDAVLHTAGSARLGLLTDQDADAWREVLETNVMGPALVARAAVPHLTSGAGLMVFSRRPSRTSPGGGSRPTASARLR